MNDLEAMTRLINALRPWLGHLVVVGGWAHHLLRNHPDAAAPGVRAVVIHKDKRNTE